MAGPENRRSPSAPRAWLGAVVAAAGPPASLAPFAAAGGAIHPDGLGTLIYLAIIAGWAFIAAAIATVWAGLVGVVAALPVTIWVTGQTETEADPVVLAVGVFVGYLGGILASRSGRAVRDGTLGSAAGVAAAALLAVGVATSTSDWFRDRVDDRSGPAVPVVHEPTGSSPSTTLP